MISDLMYIEKKTGCADDGPAWIGYVKSSKSGRTIYFNDHAFQRCQGGTSNYIDLESREAYWISGVKKRGSNRHWAGRGKIMVDRRALNELLSLLNVTELPADRFDLVDLEDRFPIERIHALLNGEI